MKALEDRSWQTIQDLALLLRVPGSNIRYHLYTNAGHVFISKELYTGKSGRCQNVWALRKNQSQPCFRWRTGHPPIGSLRHILMRMPDGRLAPGKYSSVNHCFEEWTGYEYALAFPEEYADLNDLRF